MSSALLEPALDERATLEAAFALIDADDWHADASLALDWSLGGDGGGDTSDSASSSSRTSASSPDDAAASCGADTMSATVAAPVQAAAVALPVAQKAAPARPKRSGNHNKEALARLRAEVRALQTRADTLRRQTGAAGSRLGDSSTTELVAVATNPMAFRIATGSRRPRRGMPSPLADSPLVNVWKDVAERQRLHRATSEMENVRLRALVAGHQRTVKSLKSIIQRQAALQARANVSPPTISKGKAGRCDFSPVEIAKLRDLWESLEHYYMSTGYAFQLSGLAAVGYAPLTSTNVTSLSATSMLIEVKGSALLPLDFRDTSAIMWKCIMSSFSDQDREQHRFGLGQCGIPDDGSSIVRTYSFEQRIGKLQVAMQGSHANRRYLEEHRVATVYSGGSRVLKIQGKAVAGISTTDRGRIMMSDVPSANGTMCHCQASNEIVVKVDSDRLDEKIHMKELADFMVQTKLDVYNRLRECIESAALGQPPALGVFTC